MEIKNLLGSALPDYNDCGIGVDFVFRITITYYQKFKSRKNGIAYK